MEDRIESAKAGAIAAVSGSLAAAPVGLLLPSGVGSAQWELDSDGLAISLALFGLVYRYATREDKENAMLKQGVVGAFAIPRAVATVHTSEACVPLPLVCGPPLGYLDWDMLRQLATQGVYSATAYGLAALAIESAMARGLLGRVTGKMDTTD